LDGFVPRWKGAFFAYLRQILLNQLRDEIRRVDRRPVPEELDENLPGRAPSPLEEAIGSQTLEAYEAALARLSKREQEAIVLRIELGFTYEEVAQAMGLPSRNAARMRVTRGLVRLAEEMSRGNEEEKR